MRYKTHPGQKHQTQETGYHATGRVLGKGTNTQGGFTGLFFLSEGCQNVRA